MSDDAHNNDSHHNLMVNNKKLLMWLFLGSDCMFFGTMISTHLIYRKLYPESFDPTSLFSLELTSFSTFILLMSSFLMALAVSAMHKCDIKSFRRNTLGVIFFGLIFLGCQVFEFTEFVHEGLTSYETIMNMILSLQGKKVSVYGKGVYYHEHRYL